MHSWNKYWKTLEVILLERSTCLSLNDLFLNEDYIYPTISDVQAYMDKNAESFRNKPVADYSGVQKSESTQLPFYIFGTSL